MTVTPKKVFFALLPLLVIAVGWQLYGLFGSSAQKDGKQDTAPVSQAPAKKGEVLNIGLLAPLRGQYKIFGESLERGANLAVKIINEKDGFAGHPIKLHVFDTRSEPSLNREIPKDFVQNVKLSLLIGSFEEESTQIAAQFANEAKIPFIYTSDGTMKTCKSGAALEASPYVWGLGLTNYMTVEPLLVYLADKLSKAESRFKVFFFTVQEESAEENTEFLMQAAEGLEFESVGDDAIDARVQDYFQRIRQIFPKRPDALLLSVTRKSLPRFMQQTAKLGVRAEMAIACTENFEEEMVAGLEGTADSLYTTTRYTHHIDNPENREFLAEWKKAYPQQPEPTATAVAAYSALILAKAAFDKAGKADTEAFAKAMDELEINLPQGRVVVDETNHLLIQPLYAVTVKNNAYELAEYLGDVSHPGMEACSTPQPVEEQPREEAPQRDQYEGGSDSPYGEG